jgi:hypothetical protein
MAHRAMKKHVWNCQNESSCKRNMVFGTFALGIFRMNISGASQFQVGTFPNPYLSRIMLLKSLLCFFSLVFLFLYLVSLVSASPSNLHFLAISISFHLFS